MPLLESGYKAAAKTELERDIRELESKDKAAQTRTEFAESANGIQSNITFAQRLNLIGEQQAEEMKRRVETEIAQNNFMRNEMEELTDDFENPRERSERYFNMDSVQAEINRERAAAMKAAMKGKPVAETTRRPRLCPVIPASKRPSSAANAPARQWYSPIR